MPRRDQIVYEDDSSDKFASRLEPPKLTAWERKQMQTADERVIEAMQKALDATTPERPGTPWDEREEVGERRRGYRLPSGD